MHFSYRVRRTAPRIHDFVQVKRQFDDVDEASRGCFFVSFKRCVFINENDVKLSHTPDNTPMPFRCKTAIPI